MERYAMQYSCDGGVVARLEQSNDGCQSMVLMVFYATMWQAKNATR